MKHTHRICIVGGTGFVGAHLCARLGGEERQDVKVLSRNPHKHRDLWVLPNCRFVGCNVYDEGSLQRELRDCDTVINLVGILNESGRDGSGFHRAHVELTEKLLVACRETGVERYLHMSALNAGQGESHYLRTKGEAEARVHQAARDGLAATIFQPSVIFGPGDSFFQQFALLLKLFPVLPLACPDARMAPVYILDVVEAFVGALEDRSTHGQSYELCGPKVYTLRELIELTRETLGLRRAIIGLPDALARLQGRVFDWMPFKPFTTDNYRSLQVDSVCASDGLEALGIHPRSVEAMLPHYLVYKGRQSRLRQLQSEHREPPRAA